MRGIGEKNKALTGDRPSCQASIGRTFHRREEEFRQMRFSTGFFWVAFVAFVLTSGCATRVRRPAGSDPAIEMERREQLKLSLSLLLERQVRAWKVGNRIRRAGANLCANDVRYTFGFFAVDRQTFGKEYREIAGEIGLESGVRIWEVLPEFQSPETELKRGDEILEIDGEAVWDLRSFERAIQGPFEIGQLRMKLRRTPGDEIFVHLDGALACDYRAGVVEKDGVNAFADGKNVFLTTGMMRFVDSDDELALVLGHEFAHNRLGHLRQMRAQMLAGLLVDLAVAVFAGVDTGGLFTQLARIPFSEEFEAEADYVGLYFAARAGYDIYMAPNFWRRMAVEHPGSIRENMMATHPSTPERAVGLQKSIAEIEAKRIDDQPVIPEFK